MNGFYDEKLVDNNLIKTSADKILSLSAWIFDLNFNTSKKILKQAGFLNFIKSKLGLMGIDKKLINNIILKLEENLNV